MANLLERIAGWMQPWEFPPGYVIFDAEAAALMVMNVEDPPEGMEPYKYIVVAESPQAAEQFLEESGVGTGGRWRVSPPLSIRQIREWFEGMPDEVTAVMTFSGEDFHISSRESFVEWMDETIARGAH